MKKTILVSAILVSMSACKKEKEAKAYTLSVSTTEVVNANTSFKETIQVNTEGKWDVWCDADWLTITPGTGIGNGKIELSASKNTTLSKRVATLKVIMGRQTDVITVTQNGRIPLSVSSLQVNAPTDLYKDTIDIKSDTNWTVLVSDIAAWLAVSPTSGVGDGQAIITFSKNANAASRAASFKIAAALDTAVVQVSQLGVNPEAAIPGWNLIFFDEFNQSGAIDDSKWSYCERTSTTVAWIKYQTPGGDYASLDGNNLVLKMNDSVIAGDNVPYHSGGVQSKGKFNFTYGKVEVRAKFKQGQGSWPAIWMMPETATYGGWPNSGEIDIMEHVNKESAVHQTVHNGAVTGSSGGSSATHSTSYKVDDYNVYGLEWSEDALKLYVNGALQYTYTKPANATSAQWPYDKPFYLILNQSGGAGWPGAITDADLPFNMDVDWVRVYQKP